MKRKLNEPKTTFKQDLIFTILFATVVFTLFGVIVGVVAFVEWIKLHITAWQLTQ